MKKLLSVLLVALLVAGLMTSALAGTADGKKIALVGKSAGNAFFEIAAAAFKEAGEAEGATIDVVYPEEATADAQIKVLDNLISQQPDAICISANDFNALQAKLGRQVFVNQAGTVAVGQALIDAVYDLAGGEGQWAILSATSQASNQNAWIAAMEEIAKDEKYAKLELVPIAYGDDEPQKSTDQTQALLDNYPDLKVICAPTTVGIMAAAKLVQDTEGCNVKITGLGLPSEMLEYTGEGKSCPYFYLWDMQLLGKLSAYATIALINGDITGAEGESFTVEGLGDFSITKADDGGTEIVQGLPLQFNQDNIEEMAKLY